MTDSVMLNHAQGMFSGSDLEKGVATAAAAAVTSALNAATAAATHVAVSQAAVATAAQLAQTASQAKAAKQGQASTPEGGMDTQVRQCAGSTRLREL